MGERVQVHRLDGGVVTVAIANPPVNCLSQQVVRELSAIFSALHSDRSLRAVIVRGAGPRGFCAGGDIKDFIEYGQSDSDPVAHSEFYQRMIDGAEQLPCPVIAAIQGFCLGGGLELALGCDIRIAAASARFGLPEIQIGIIPGGGGTQRLPRTVGPTAAKYMILSGEMIDASEAHRIGLVARVVPDDQLFSEAESLARRIAAAAPLAVAACKRAIDKGINMALHEGLAFESRCLADSWNTQDRQEGVTAFLEKRQPVFQGR